MSEPLTLKKWDTQKEVMKECVCVCVFGLMRFRIKTTN